ncbi:hypothetical protein Syun_015217 [Stephania yunnanensis]|uniref:Leucine-rich repeat-containing N-terminal plant-type domain-containing protein n=1 Tax=Stephania yunnanensis TaxID=152371 RepID=A0AAP0JN34_9MAGN
MGFIISLFTLPLLLLLSCQYLCSSAISGGIVDDVKCVTKQKPRPRTYCGNSPSPMKFADKRLATVYPVIQAFKKSVTRDPFNVTKTWVGTDICNYKGFYCDNPPDNKSAIALASADFNGFRLAASTLDGFLDKLPDLALFHANSNKFTGTVSNLIAKLQYLYELDISNNNLTGPFPPPLLMPNNITFVDIRYNQFSGSVPPQIFTKPLDVLFLNNNNFDQFLPENLGSTTALYLNLANNYFTGPIPRSIGQAASTLLEILLLNNRLSGCLPYEIGYLKMLTLFDAGLNQLTGPIPLSFACLEKIEQLNLAGNMFYGAVPELLCMVKSLTNLSLSDNYFSFVGPFCTALIGRGVLDLRNNCVPGLPFQRSSLECARFFFHQFFEHPKFCDHPYSFAYVPCNLTHIWGNERRSTTGGVTGRPSPSYAALEKHRT